MIDENDMIIEEYIPPNPRRPNDKQIFKKYRAYCDECGCDRGYKRKSGLRQYCQPCASKRYGAQQTQEDKQSRNAKMKITNAKKSSKEKQKIIDKTNQTKRDRGLNFRTEIERKIADRLRIALKNNQKTGSAVDDLGCSIPEFKVYIESLWVEGMSWGNYNKTGWHMDHILPLVLFDLTNRRELLKAVNYTNIQPLWAHDNQVKSAKR